MRQPLTLWPSNPGGSVEHFYHFALSYLLPLDEYIAVHDVQSIQVRDCGPMNPWFDLLPANVVVSILPAHTSVREVRSLGTVKYVPTLENSWRGRRSQKLRLDNLVKALMKARRISAIRRRVLERCELSDAPMSPQATIIERAPSLPFYLSEAEILGSGAERRSLPNIEEVFAAVSQVSASQMFLGEFLTPLEQIATMSQTTILVGQHGAGLANMVWMKPGGLVVEVLPQEIPPHLSRLFSKLARACGHSYVVIGQESSHSPVDPHEIVQALLAN